VVLFGRAYWQGLLDWIKDTLVAEGKIAPEDMQLLVLTDTAEEACRLISECYARQCWDREDRSVAVQLGLIEPDGTVEPLDRDGRTGNQG
jgi:predicted Rossmann-fold nucleotide-binding protein